MGRFGEWVRAHCRSSCNACATECADDYRSCQTWKDRGFCYEGYVAFMHTHCKKNCDVCNVQQLNIRSHPMDIPDFGMPASPPDIDIEVVSGAVSRGLRLLLIIASVAPALTFCQ